MLPHSFCIVSLCHFLDWLYILLISLLSYLYTQFQIAFCNWICSTCTFTCFSVVAGDCLYQYSPFLLPWLQDSPHHPLAIQTDAITAWSAPNYEILLLHAFCSVGTICLGITHHSPQLCPQLDSAFYVTRHAISIPVVFYLYERMQNHFASCKRISKTSTSMVSSVGAINWNMSSVSSTLLSTSQCTSTSQLSHSIGFHILLLVVFFDYHVTGRERTSASGRNLARREMNQSHASVYWLHLKKLQHTLRENLQCNQCL